jgi:septal ring factor EnvC (AmiA/AmiB activator)
MEYVLKLSEQEIQIVGAALNELPRKISNNLVNKIQAQVTEQEQAEERRIKKLKEEKEGLDHQAMGIQEHLAKVEKENEDLEQRLKDKQEELIRTLTQTK